MILLSRAGSAWRRAWRRVSLRTKIYLGYVALITMPLLIVAAAADQTSAATIKENAQTFSAQLTVQIRDNLDAYGLHLDRLTYWPFQALGVQQVLRRYQTSPAELPSLRDVTAMHATLDGLGHARGDLAAIYVVTADGTLFHWTASGDVRMHPRTTTAAWYRAALAADPRTVFLPTQGQQMISVATGKVFSLVRALHDPRTGRRDGAVRIDVDAVSLAGVAQQVSLGTQGRLLVVAPDGSVAYPVDPSAATRRLAAQVAAQVFGPPAHGQSVNARAGSGRLQLDVAGQALLATYAASPTSGWIVVGVVPTAQLLSGADHLRALILSVAALSVVAGALCATLVVNRLTQPLHQLQAAMRRVEARGDLDTRLEVRSDDDVGQLTQGFNAMLDELRRLVDDVLRAQIHEREAELHALQNQINPHFLYNTLESINMLALTHGDRDTSRMVTALGRLLRLTISSAGALIPLHDELSHLDHYLTLQRMRYGDRMTMEVEVADGLRDYLLPKLTLQPIVENALYHGLEARRGSGRITVRGRRQGTDLVIEIEDDGSGMDVATLAALRTRLGQAQPRGSRSLGLANVHHRLVLYCGAGYGLHVESTPGRGTRVTVRIARTPREEWVEGDRLPGGRPGDRSRPAPVDSDPGARTPVGT